MDKKMVITSKKYRGDTSTITVRLPETLINELEEISRKTGRSRNELVQQCIEFSLKNAEIVEEE